MPGKNILAGLWFRELGRTAPVSTTLLFTLFQIPQHKSTQGARLRALLPSALRLNKEKLLPAARPPVPASCCHEIPPPVPDRLSPGCQGSPRPSLHSAARGAQTACAGWTPGRTAHSTWPRLETQPCSPESAIMPFLSSFSEKSHITAFFQRIKLVN